jgi:hypothetical protein
MARLYLGIGEYKLEEWFWIIDLLGYNVILGQPWLKRHNPAINCAKQTITFNLEHYHQNYLTYGLPVRLLYPTNRKSHINTLEPLSNSNIRMIKA